MPDDRTLNPQVTDVLIGIRNLRKVSIFPLSMHDQMELNNVVTEAVRAFFEMSAEDSEEGLVSFIQFMLGLIQENMTNVIGLITDENPKDILKEISNVQAMEIAGVIYDQNYESLVKNLKSLLQGSRLKEAMSSPMIKRSPRSANSMDTN